MGWLPFAVVMYEDLIRISAKVSSLMKHAYKIACLGISNMRAGAYLPHPSGQFWFSARPSGICADEKALKEVRSLKGSAGSVCCGQCKNILNTKRESLKRDDFYKHYSTAMPTEFRRHTDASVFELYDYLESEYPQMSSKQFNDLCQELGANYTPEGIMHCGELRRAGTAGVENRASCSRHRACRDLPAPWRSQLARRVGGGALSNPCSGLWLPVSMTRYDYMHVYLCCSGFIQLILNAFLLHVERSTPFSLEAIDAFAQTLWKGITQPVWKRLSSDFFQKRIAQTNLEFPQLSRMDEQMYVLNCTTRLHQTVRVRELGYLALGRRFVLEGTESILGGGANLFSRINRGASGLPLRCFASETIVALYVLALFARMVLAPAELLLDHCGVLDAARKVVVALKQAEMNPDAVSAQSTRTMIQELHSRALGVYGVACCKVKSHMQHHIMDGWHSRSRLVSCFSCEARNRLIKSLGNHALGVRDRSARAQHVLRRLLAHLEHSVSQFTFKRVSITRPRSSIDLCTLLPDQPRPVDVHFPVAPEFNFPKADRTNCS